MDLMEFIEQTMKKHNVKVSLEEVLEAIRIEYEEQAKDNKKGIVGVVGLDDATVEAIIIEAPAVIERNKDKQKANKSVVMTSLPKAKETKKTTAKAKPEKQKMVHFSQTKKDEMKGVDADDETKNMLEQLGLWS